MNTINDPAQLLAFSLTQRIGESRFNLWFAGKTKFILNHDHLAIGVANLVLHDWLQKTFAADIKHCAAETLGPELPVRFFIDAQLFQGARREQAKALEPASAPPQPERRADKPHRQRRLHSLDDFIVGPGNRVAHACALGLIEAPEESPIPLLVHGAVGTGKTHWLEGTAAALARRFPDWRILMLTAEDFTNRFVQAMHQHKLPAFRKQFRACDALLIDDVGFFAKKQATQEELLHTLDALIAAHRPIILTADCHPRLADHFMPELTDRLVGGAVWSLLTPDRPTRLEILRAKALRAGGMPADVLDFLADHLRGNVREIQGAIHGVVHLAKATARPIDLDLAREALGDLLRHSIRMVRLDDVEFAVCDVLGVSRELLFSKKRQWIHTYPRMLAMYLARKHTSATFSEVGQHFGGRNHSTVVAAEKKVRGWLQTNLTLQLGKRILPIRDIVEQIERKLES